MDPLRRRKRLDGAQPAGTRRRPPDPAPPTDDGEPGAFAPALEEKWAEAWRRARASQLR